VLLGWL